MKAQFVLRTLLTLLVTGIFTAATLHAQTSTQTTTDSTTTDTTQTTTPATSSQNCGTPCPPQALPRTSIGGGPSAELYVNAGGIWPSRIDEFGDNNKIKAQGVYGLKGGLIWGGSELEVSVGYLNHFEPSRSPNPFDVNTVGTFGTPTVYALMYDVNWAWNFGNRRVLGAKFEPYIVAGPGGLTAEVRHGNSAFFEGGGVVLDASGTAIPNPGPTRIIHSGDTFFTVNYGGGFKAANLWGPIGIRADLRGRTIPNFFHTTPSWPELTAGLLVSWGQQ